MAANASLPLSWIDYSVFVAYLAILCVVGFVSGKGERASSAGYFLAGRTLPWFVVGGSFIAANISTEHFIGMVGASYIFGIAPALYEWVTSFVFVLMIFVFIPFLIKSRIATVPQYLSQRYGPGVRQTFAVITILANIVIFMAAVLYTGGLALSGFLGWPLTYCIVASGVFAGGWAVYGGLSTVAWTGLITAIVKLGGVGLLTILGLKAVAGGGSIVDGFFAVIDHNRADTGVWHEALARSVPKLTSEGTYNRLSVIQAPDHPMAPWTGIFLLFLSVGIWYSVLNQFIVQRVLGARDLWHARMGIVLVGYAKVILPALTVLPGLILFSLHPEFMLGDWASAQHQADGGFIVLVKELLPAGLRGLLLAVLFSAVQATITSVVNSTATVLTLDVYVPRFRPAATDREVVRVGIIASLLTVVAGIATAIIVSRLDGGIFRYIQSLNAFFAPPFAAIFLVGLFWRRANGTGAMMAIVGGFLVAILIKVAGYAVQMPGWYYPFANQAAVCWAVAALLCIGGSLWKPVRASADTGAWNFRGILTESLGDGWYRSGVVLWTAGFVVLTISVMVLFSNLFFPAR
jgi:SSS family solute:Na+ symporter